MSKGVIGGILTLFGLVMLVVFGFVLNLPEGLSFTASFLLGVVPAVGGVAMLWANMRGSTKRRDPEVERLNAIKDQIVWRALALGGRITAAQAADQGDLAPMDAEHALMSLVSEGRAAVEPGEAGEIVYRVEMPGSAASS